MATIVFLGLVIAAFLTLSMRKAPMWAWALAVGALTYIAQSGLLSGGPPATGFLSYIAWLPFIALALLLSPVIGAMIGRL